MMFFTNLQKPTFDHHVEAGSTPQAWLLSSHRATGAEVGRARTDSVRGQRLMADNGTIVHIRTATARYEADADALISLSRAHRSTLPGRPRDIAIAAMPDEIVSRGAALSTDIALDVDGTFESIAPASQRDVQLRMDPTDMICKEDWSVAVLLGLGLERNITGWSVERFVTRNRQSLRGWKADAAAAPDVSSHFVTLGAADYPSARAVAREAADWGAENVALGFAGLNSTGGYTAITRCPVRRSLVCPGPRRYVRLAEIVTGFRDGYRERGATLQRFHALGLGARQMWAILAAGLDWWTDISVDATSAIKDAEGRRPVLYNPANPAGRVAVAAVADHFVLHGDLPFESPMLAGELSAQDRTAAAKHRDQHGPVTHDQLRGGRALADALPLFRNGPGSSAAGRLHAMHNYWASEVAAATVPERGRRAWALAELQHLQGDPRASITMRTGARVALDVLQ